MIKATITFRESLKTQAAKASGRLLHPMSNLRSSEVFFVAEEEVDALRTACEARGWEIDLDPVYMVPVGSVLNRVAAAAWSDADDVEFAAIRERMAAR